MVEARQRSDWWHTAALMATVVNCLRAKGTKPVTPSALHPCLKQKAPPLISGKGLSILRDVFCQPPKK
jgi:hypothetical protein